MHGCSLPKNNQLLGAAEADAAIAILVCPRRQARMSRGGPWSSLPAGDMASAASCVLLGHAKGRVIPVAACIRAHVGLSDGTAPGSHVKVDTDAAMPCSCMLGPVRRRTLSFGQPGVALQRMAGS